MSSTVSVRAPPASLWLPVHVAFLVANAVALAALVYQLSQRRTDQQPKTNTREDRDAREETEGGEGEEEGPTPPANAVEFAAATETAAGEEESTVANSPLAPDQSQTFRSTHTLHAGKAQETKVQRTVLCMDTNAYLHSIPIPPRTVAAPPAAKPSAQPASVAPSAVSSHPWSRCSIITSVPDVSETGLSLSRWRPWFRHVCQKMLDRLDDDQVAIFYQTDIRAEGEWVSKAYLVMQAAEKAGMKLIWHKIVLVNSVHTIRGSTASFVNLLCFSRQHRETLLTLTPDVLAHRGTMLWKRAMGLRACEFACKYIRAHVPTARAIVDPFCGSGSTLSMANQFGLDAIGVDHCRKRCVQASTLDVAALDDFGGADCEKTLAWQAEKKETLARRKEERATAGRTQKEQQVWEKEQKRKAREEKAKEDQE